MSIASYANRTDSRAQAKTCIDTHACTNTEACINTDAYINTSTRSTPDLARLRTNQMSPIARATR
jgi:hypothetical protein